MALLNDRSALLNGGLDSVIVEMREIEAFLAVADELHFGRAAQRLHVTTASVSQAIRALERRVGGPLFERTSRQVALTSIGVRLRAGIEPAYQQMRASLYEAQRASRPSGRDILRAGFSTTMPADLTARVITRFEGRVVGCRIARIDLPGTEALRWFEQGEFQTDVFVGWMPDPALGPRPAPPWVEIGPVIRRSTRLAVMHRTHSLAGRSTLDIEDLVDHDVLRPYAYPDFADGWLPAETHGGRSLRRIQQERAWYVEDLISRVTGDNLIHLSAMDAFPALERTGLVGVPLTGLPPLALAALWPKNTDNPWVAEFAKLAAVEP